MESRFEKDDRSIDAHLRQMVLLNHVGIPTRGVISLTNSGAFAGNHVAFAHTGQAALYVKPPRELYVISCLLVVMKSRPPANPSIGWLFAMEFDV